MEKTRVPKGEKYWYINDCLYVSEGYERGICISEVHFIKSNYFHTKEEAEAMARKLRAVLKGADVIEMPSEDDMLGAIPIIDDPCDYIGPGRRLGWSECYTWLKSKIVK